MKQHRIAVSCGEGFASGFLAGHLNIFAAQEGISDKVIFIRIPYMDLYEHQHEFDMAMILPHIEWKVKEDTKNMIFLYISFHLKLLLNQGLLTLFRTVQILWL